MSADSSFLKGLWKTDLYDKTSQALAVFLPVKPVGVTGDGRRHDYAAALRIVETTNLMSACRAHLPYGFLDHVSRRIIKEVPGIPPAHGSVTDIPPVPPVFSLPRTASDSFFWNRRTLSVRGPEHGRQQALANGAALARVLFPCP